MATIFRGPVVHRPPGRPNTVDRGFVGPTELQLLGKDQFFAAPGEAPCYDWPNPRGKPFPIDLRGFTDAAPVHLLGKDQFFSAAGEAPRYDWPNPRGKPFPQDQRGFLNPAETHLFGKDQFFAAAGQPPAYDWPNPSKRRPSALSPVPAVNFLALSTGAGSGNRIRRVICSGA